MQAKATSQFLVFQIVTLMIYLHNRQPQRTCHLLNDRGVNQAGRNNSDSIWETLGSHCHTTNLDSYPVCTHCRSQTTNLTQQGQAEPQYERSNSNEKEFLRSGNNQLISTKPETEFMNSKKEVSFTGVSQKDRVMEDRSKEKLNASPIQKQKQKIVSKSKERVQGKEQPKQENGMDVTEYLNQRKELQQYLQSQKAYTRTLPNSAFSKFYQKPVPQVYGSGNTHRKGIIYGQYLKTHNIQPHSLDNNPKKYQTYRSALNFGKRTKLDLEDKWIRIERELAKTLKIKLMARNKADMIVDVNEGNENEVLRENIRNRDGERMQRSSERRFGGRPKSATSKSTNYDAASTLNTERDRGKANPSMNHSGSDKELYFIYRYEDKDGYKRYARDRHGITCYVDPAFKENDQAYTNFQKKISPIEAEDVDESDRNLDKIRVDNYLKGKEDNYPRHYLTPNVEYNPLKYSLKAQKRKNGK